MCRSLKVIICFQTRIEEYIEENNLPPKLSSYPVVPRAIEFTTKSDFMVQNYNHRR